MNTLYVIDEQPNLIFLFFNAMQNHQDHFTGSKQTDINAWGSQPVGYNNGSTLTVFFPASEKTVPIDGMFYRRILFEQTYLTAMRMSSQHQIGIRNIRIFRIIRCMGE